MTTPRPLAPLGAAAFALGARREMTYAGGSFADGW